PARTVPYPLSLHDALPICWVRRNRENLPFGIGERGGTRMVVGFGVAMPVVLLSALFIWSDVFVIQKTQPARASSTSLTVDVIARSEEHTSELQSRFDLVCR